MKSFEKLYENLLLMILKNFVKSTDLVPLYFGFTIFFQSTKICSKLKSAYSSCKLPVVHRMVLVICQNNKCMWCSYDCYLCGRSCHGSLKSWFQSWLKMDFFSFKSRFVCPNCHRMIPWNRSPEKECWWSEKETLFY